MLLRVVRHRNTKEAENLFVLTKKNFCVLRVFVVFFTQNKSPDANAKGDWFDLSDGSTFRASPNDTRIVVVIIVIGEVEIVLHGGGIIA
jgi:hypothetical protein